MLETKNDPTSAKAATFFILRNLRFPNTFPLLSFFKFLIKIEPKLLE